MKMTMFIAMTLLASGVANAQTGNTAYGDFALSNNTGNNDSAFGDGALNANNTGSYNTASGAESLVTNTIGNGNSAMGYRSIEQNRGGSYNTAQGFESLYTNNSGNYNTALGIEALYLNASGSNNTAVGVGALLNISSGSDNIGIGSYAGYLPTSGHYNIEIGHLGLSADNGVIRIGTQGTQHFTAIAGISGVKVINGAQVLVNAKGQLGVASSSIRYKQNVNPMGDASDKVLSLRPVTFQYKEAEEDGSKPIQYGLIAEEVEKVMPDLVVYNDKGQPETVAYQTLAPLLLNELQKEHRRTERQERETSELRQQLASVTAQLTELREVAARLAAK